MSRYNVQTGDLVGPVHLRRIDPAANAHRYWSAAVWPDLFGAVSLAREWGRIGSPGRLHLTYYPDAERAAAALRRLVREKERKGYTALSTESGDKC